MNKGARSKPLYLYLCLIFAWRHAGVMLEVFPEERRIREVHVVSHFLNGHGRILQQCLCFQNHIFVYPLAGGLSADFLDDGREVLWTQEQLLGIEIYPSFLAMMFAHQVDELLE